MSSLENLKKQAKALVRLHRERSYHLACVARETLPKFADLTDRQVLAAEFKLADAQAIVARQNGYDSWTDLKAKAGEPELPPAQALFGLGVLFAVPMLYVADVRRAVDHYVRALGFSANQVSGEPPFYAEVQRGGAVLALRLVHGEAIAPDVRAREPMLLQASVRVGDAKALYLEFLAGGAIIDAPLQRDAFGPQGFVVKDLDGNLIAFGEPGPAARARAASGA